MGSIQGTVTSTLPILPPEIVVLIDSGPPHPDVAAIADAAGRFSLTGLGDGDYRVSAYVNGIRRASQLVRVRGAAAVEVQLDLGEPS